LEIQTIEKSHVKKQYFQTLTQHFCIFTGAGTGSLGLAIEGPSEAKMTCVDNRDGSCTIEYMPTESGVYDVSIQFAETHIPGSPFKVLFKLS